MAYEKNWHRDGEQKKLKKLPKAVKRIKLKTKQLVKKLKDTDNG